MASREGQGMQIAVILFAILTVVLAVTTYIYYAAAETKEKDRVAAKAAEDVATKAQKKANYQATALMYMLGFKTREDVTRAKEFAGGGEDTEVNTWLAQRDSDMALYGAVGTDAERNYIQLPAFLITSISQKHAGKLVAEKVTLDEQAARKVDVDAQTARATTAENGLSAQVASNADASTKHNESLGSANKAAADAQGVYVAAQAKAKKDMDEKDALFNSVANSLGKEQIIKKQFADELAVARAVQGVNIDNPDATILWINQKQRLVWIDRGFDDGLGRQMSFAIYSQNQASLFTQVERMRKEGTGLEKVKKLSSKGRIEVVRVTGPHEAECRILEDKVSDPILPGDWIHSPAWSPGQRLHFALVGFMDIDGDQQSDRETIKHIISMNGGVVDSEIKDNGERDEGKMSVNTRYVVTGDSSERGNLAIKNLTAYQTTRNAFFKEVADFSVEKISVQQLLDMMGWKPEVKTTGLGGLMDAGFSKRGPGAAKAVPAAPGGEKPAAKTPPAEEAPKAKAPAAAEPADPFGGK